MPRTPIGSIFGSKFLTLPLPAVRSSASSWVHDELLWSIYSWVHDEQMEVTEPWKPGVSWSYVTAEVPQKNPQQPQQFIMPAMRLVAEGACRVQILGPEGEGANFFIESPGVHIESTG